MAEPLVLHMDYEGYPHFEGTRWADHQLLQSYYEELCWDPESLGFCYQKVPVLAFDEIALVVDLQTSVSGTLEAQVVGGFWFPVTEGPSQDPQGRPLVTLKLPKINIRAVVAPSPFHQWVMNQEDPQALPLYQGIQLPKVASWSQAIGALRLQSEPAHLGHQWVDGCSLSSMTSPSKLPLWGILPIGYQADSEGFWPTTERFAYQQLQAQVGLEKWVRKGALVLWEGQCFAR